MPHKACPKQFKNAKTLKLCTVSEPEDPFANEQVTIANAWTKPTSDEAGDEWCGDDRNFQMFPGLGGTMLIRSSQSFSDEQVAKWSEEWPPLGNGDHGVKKPAEQRNDPQVNGAGESKTSDGDTGNTKMKNGQKENRNTERRDSRRRKNRGPKAESINNRQHQNYREESYGTERKKYPSKNPSSDSQEAGRKPLNIRVLADFLENLHLVDRPKQVQEETKETDLDKISKKKRRQVMKKKHEHTQGTSQKCDAPSGYNNKKHRRNDATGQNKRKRTSSHHRNVSFFSFYYILLDIWSHSAPVIMTAVCF
ncbi:hypothetical protein GCK32_017356 [Trichostrongylus colubriformis]|uniref:Uncharacterized protein n=1 Tax=Trichostrongylus colubriformis TaxID=6319 RepID=A0AAN8FUG1_TRICO